jgi:outer membrane lipoprotein-sorting protein
LMLAQFFLYLALASSIGNPLASALESFHRVATYRVTIQSMSGDSRQIIRYFFKRPGFVRMEFITPHKEAVLVYRPDTKKARLRPFGFLKPFVLTLAPDNGLITDPQGHRVDVSDIGAFLETVKTLADKGESRIKGDDKVGGRQALLVEVRGGEGVSVNGNIHRYLLWLDARTLMPLRTQSFAADGAQVEDVLMEDLEINVELPDSLFAM